MKIHHSIVCLFVCIDALHPSQHFFGHVGTEPPLPGYFDILLNLFIAGCVIGVQISVIDSL